MENKISDNVLSNEKKGYSQIEELNQLTFLERFWVGLAVLFVLVFALLDFFEDINKEAGSFYLVIDIGYVVVMLSVLAYLWRFLPLSLKRENIALTSQIIQQHKDIDAWQSKASQTINGFSRLIADQFEKWQLSSAEKEVALLLLKGLCLKEVSVIRGTSYGTTRQQSTSLYEKAGVSGRAELTAFFLEDLLLPSST